MKRDAGACVEEMLDSISKIQSYTKGMDAKGFESDFRAQDAVMRRLEIIGEASKGLLPETKAKYPQIQWKEIVGMRDVLTHAYFGISMGRVWKVVEEDVPKLKAVLAEISKNQK